MRYQCNLKKMIVLITIFSEPAISATLYQKQAHTEIYGSSPYFDSIGSKVIKSDRVIDGVLQISVGAMIEVPSHEYEFNSQIKNPFFSFIDHDNDVATVLGNDSPGSLPTDLIPSKFTQVRWFIIEAAEGYKFADEVSKSGEIITRWTPEQIRIVSEITDGRNVNFFTDNKNSKSLIVPEAAVGYRIGFWVLPETENGIPNAGNWIKVFDLNKFFSQKAPSGPGPGEWTDTNHPHNPDPDIACINLNCGIPSVDNPGGGGGLVTGADWIINIYDVIDPDDPSKDILADTSDTARVNHEYYATIRILEDNSVEGIGAVYRDPTEKELETLEWEIINLETDETIASYSEKNNPTRVNNNAGTITIGAQTFKRYWFKTQFTNAEAQQILQETGPQYSEQGWGIRVKIVKDE
ncbi:hypothetical protein [Thorsellia anophelis]|uniref:Uncharacterized protein n=1 Tax=Thorsellia anophelis DSM 18579 TaxID=1123402 RepID=A0A1H9Z886_9GAMM|nr:hypothetical protein [Thorsellia anophelis]SES77539.1 hypothetical protein SAMN02583745_00460 [Thorsellia anophelis DSM 18579]